MYTHARSALGVLENTDGLHHPRVVVGVGILGEGGWEIGKWSVSSRGSGWLHFGYLDGRSMLTHVYY